MPDLVDEAEGPFGIRVRVDRSMPPNMFAVVSLGGAYVEGELAAFAIGDELTVDEDGVVSRKDGLPLLWSMVVRRVAEGGQP
jgi:hypothetical protein